MKEFFKRHPMLTSLIVIVLAIVGVNCLMLISTPFTAKGDNDWIAFYGSLLGGLLGGIATLFGVKLTLDRNEKLDEDKKRLSLIPYLSVESQMYDPDGETTYYQLTAFKDEKNKFKSATYIVFTLIFKNLGIGTAINLQFDKLNDLKYERDNGSGFSGINIQPYHLDKSYYITNVFAEYYKSKFKSGEYKLSYFYNDITGKYKYKQEVFMDINVEKDYRGKVKILNISSPELINIVD